MSCHITRHPTQPEVSPSPHRSHIDAIDLVRVITCACVVGVHVVGMVRTADVTAGWPHILAGATATFLHYTRESFMVVTGLVLSYQHKDGLRPFPFWGRRLLDRVLPYLFWSFVYIFIYLGMPGEHLWTKHVLSDLWLGNASYQLYYMVVTFQFYLIFPVIWLLFRTLPRHHLVIVGVALLDQILWYMNFGPLYLHFKTAPWPWGAFNQIHFIVTYPFFFTVGVWAGVHFEQVSRFLRKHARWAVLLSLLGVTIMEGHYLWTVLSLKESVSLGIAVLQPSMILASVSMVVVLLVLGMRFFEKEPGRYSGAFRRVIVSISEASLGIFLVHVIFLRTFFKDLMPHWTAPPLLQMFILWALTFGASYLLIRILMALPGTGLLVGHRPKKTFSLRSRPRDLTP